VTEPIVGDSITDFRAPVQGLAALRDFDPDNIRFEATGDMIIVRFADDSAPRRREEEVPM